MSAPSQLVLPGDRAAITLSTLCAVHCIVLPLIIPLLPWLALFARHETEIHRWLLFAIVPISVYALAQACARHRRLAILGFGAIGLTILIAAAFAEFLPSQWESQLTLVGTVVLTLAHLLNLRALRQWRGQSVQLV